MKGNDGVMNYAVSISIKILVNNGDFRSRDGFGTPVGNGSEYCI